MQITLRCMECNLLVTNHEDEMSAIMDKEIITAKKSVKLLGMTRDNKLDSTFKG